MMKILLVDDEKTERNGLRFLIGKFRLPFEVAEAENGKKAWEYIEEYQDIDVLLTDVKMPHMDGLELAGRVKEAYPEILIVIYSAYGEFDYAQRAFQANAVNYLLKPIEIKVFQEVMERVMELFMERQQRKLLMDTDRKQLLCRLIRSHEIYQVAEVLKQKHGLDLEGKHMCLVSVETRGNYFEKNEEEFEEILGSIAGQEFAVIPLYPDLSYILLYRKDPYREEVLEEMVRRIYDRLLKEKRESFSVIVGKVFYGIGNLKNSLQELETVLKDTFGFFSGIRCLDGIGMEEKGIRTELLYGREHLYECIRKKDFAAIRKQFFSDLFLLQKEEPSSAFLVKYLVLDMVKALYQEFGGLREQALLQAADDVAHSDSLEDIYRTVSSILEQMEGQDREEMPDTSLTIREIRQKIANEYMNDIGLDEIAEQMRLSPSYVSYIFRKEMGCTLIRYLTECRLNHAKEMLESSNRRIADIGRDCGYANPSYFNKMFKRYFGMTPGQYRKRWMERQWTDYGTGL